MKKFSILLCIPAFACSLSCQAHQQNKFFIGLEGGLFKQTNAAAYTAIDSASTSRPLIGVLHRITPKHKFSGGFTLGYWLDHAVDIQFSAFFNDHKKTDALLVPGAGQHIDTILVPSDWRLDFADDGAQSEFSYRTNSYSLTMGEWFQPTSKLRIHPYFGINVSDIKDARLTHYFALDGESDKNATISESSSVTGVGPLLGVSLSYPLHPQFSVIADLNITILAGNIESLHTATADDENPADARSKIDTALFERFGAKLGLSYRFITKQTDTYVQIGYKATEYIGATSTLNMPSARNEGLTVHSFGHTGFSGPFLSATVHV